MNFGTLDMNNLVLLVIAAFTLANTVIAGFNARQSVTRTQLARETKAVAVETRDIAQKTEANTKSIVSEAKQERAKMAVLLDDALNGARKVRRK